MSGTSIALSLLYQGYFLLFESMYDTVIYARDKWLSPGGAVLPTHAAIYLTAISDEARYADHIDYWSDVYGTYVRVWYVCGPY